MFGLSPEDTVTSGLHFYELFILFYLFIFWSCMYMVTMVTSGGDTALDIFFFYIPLVDTTDESLAQPMRVMSLEVNSLIPISIFFLVCFIYLLT